MLSGRCVFPRAGEHAREASGHGGFRRLAGGR